MLTALIGLVGSGPDVADLKAAWCERGYVHLDADEIVRGLVLAVDPILHTRSGERRATDVVGQSGWDGVGDVEAARLASCTQSVIRYLTDTVGADVWLHLLTLRIDKLVEAGATRIVVTGLKGGSDMAWVARQAHGHRIGTGDTSFGEEHS